MDKLGGPDDDFFNVPLSTATTATTAPPHYNQQQQQGRAPTQKTVLNATFMEAAKRYDWMTVENTTRLNEYAQEAARLVAPALPVAASKATIDGHILPMTMADIATIWTNFAPDCPQPTILQLKWEKTALTMEQAGVSRLFADPSVLEITLTSSKGSAVHRAETSKGGGGESVIRTFITDPFDAGRITSVTISMLAEAKWKSMNTVATAASEPPQRPTADSAAIALEELNSGATAVATDSPPPQQRTERQLEAAEVIDPTAKHHKPTDAASSYRVPFVTYVPLVTICETERSASTSICLFMTTIVGVGVAIAYGIITIL